MNEDRLSFPASSTARSGPFAGLRAQYAVLIYAAAAALGLAVGAALWLWVSPGWASSAWTIGTLAPLVALLIQMVTSLRRGDIGLDAIAFLAMSAALLFGEPLAANVVALMYSGGQLLESFAEGRARREMTALLGRVASTAMRLVDDAVVEVPITAIVPGDRILIRHGEVVPVDGRVATAPATIEASALTGEFEPLALIVGEDVMSGSTSVGSAFELVATRGSKESTYAAIVALVEAARAEKPPAQRLADRYALGFLVVTLLIAGAAWFISGDHIRALSVLVVATPCPLILAVPVAMISGLSRAARIGVLIKGGGALEALTAVRTAVLDKTGTLTQGQATVSKITAFPGFAEDEVLATAASLDQASSHVMAAALIRAARLRRLAMPVPTDVSEQAGAGIEGVVGGRQVAVGGRRYVASALDLPSPSLPQVALEDGSAHVWVGIAGRMAGVVHLEDRLRDDAGQVLSALRQMGVSRIVLASGDTRANAEAVGRALGVDEVLSELTPADKVAIVRREEAKAPVMMVGDGVNDAPALAAARVGVAMGARGEAASSEAADIVVLIDQIEPLGKAMSIARRTRAIAVQSVAAGIGLSLTAMVVAAFGYLPPVTGALVQEAIDVAVILNALRALR